MYSLEHSKLHQDYWGLGFRRGATPPASQFLLTFCVMFLVLTFPPRPSCSCVTVLVSRGLLHFLVRWRPESRRRKASFPFPTGGRLPRLKAPQTLGGGVLAFSLSGGGRPEPSWLFPALDNVTPSTAPALSASRLPASSSDL